MNTTGKVLSWAKFKIRPVMSLISRIFTQLQQATASATSELVRITPLLPQSTLFQLPNNPH